MGSAYRVQHKVQSSCYCNSDVNCSLVLFNTPRSRVRVVSRGDYFLLIEPYCFAAYLHPHGHHRVEENF